MSGRWTSIGINHPSGTDEGFRPPAAPSPPSRRWQYVRFSPSLLISMSGMTRPFTCQVVGDPLPRDARFRAVCFDDMTQMFMILVESESFPEVPEGGIIPQADIQFEVVLKEVTGE